MTKKFSFFSAKIFFLALVPVLAGVIFFLGRKYHLFQPPLAVVEAPPNPFSAVDFNPIYGKVILCGSKDKPKIALSFDADMTPLMKRRLEEKKVDSYFDERIIDILRKENVPATLFLAGLWAEAYPQATKELSYDSLFEIGNHSYSHPAFAWPCFHLKPITDTEKENELQESQEALFKITGHYPNLFRFPGGCYQKKDLDLTKKYGLTVVGWDVDSRDAFNTNAKQILKTVMKDVGPGSILIFHLMGNRNSPKTAEVLPLVISQLKEKGYSFVKVGELIGKLNP